MQQECCCMQGPGVVGTDRGRPVALQAKVRFILRVIAVVAVAVTGFVVSDGQWLVPLLFAVFAGAWASGLGRATGLFNVLGLGVVAGGAASHSVGCGWVVCGARLAGRFPGRGDGDRQWYSQGRLVAAWLGVAVVLPMLAVVLRLACSPVSRLGMQFGRPFLGHCGNGVGGGDICPWLSARTGFVAVAVVGAGSAVVLAQGSGCSRGVEQRLVSVSSTPVKLQLRPERWLLVRDASS